MALFKVIRVEHTEVELTVEADSEEAARLGVFNEVDSETLGSVAPTEVLVVAPDGPNATTERPVRVPSLHIPEEAWEPCGPEEDTGEPGDPAAELTCTVTVNGVSFHADAYAVVSAELGLEAAHPDFEEDLDRVYAAAHVEGRFDTVEIAGREYVVILTPHT